MDSEVFNMAANGNSEGNLETGNHSNGGEEGERVEVQGRSERAMAWQEREIFLQMELFADEDNDSPEIKRKKRMARTALTMWKERLEALQLRNLQRKSDRRSIMNEVYNLVSLYSVFVGVVLTAVATSDRLHCPHLWSPVGLSLFAYSMVVVAAFTKFRLIRELERSTQVEHQACREITVWMNYLRRRGYADFDFDRDCRDRPFRNAGAPLWRNALGLIVPLTMFTAGLVFSLVHILCWS